MSQLTDGNIRAFTAGEALNAFCRVKLDTDGTIIYADADHDAIGITEAAIADAAVGPVRLSTASGTVKIRCAGALSIGDTVYGAADGEIDDATDGVLVGVAIEAATAAHDVIEVVPAVAGTGGTAVLGGTVAVAADALAIPITHSLVTKTTGADAEALTLANGKPGQILTIQLAVDGGGSGTLTPTTVGGFATIVFADAGDVATLMYIDDTVGWVILGAAGAAAPPVIT